MKTPLKLHVNLNSDKGSALIMVLLIITIMCTIGLAVLMLTFSDFTISSLFSDQNKAYNAAEAAQNISAQALDQKVAALQETARSQASSYIQDLLAVADSPLIKRDGSIDSAAVEALFKAKYQEFFLQGMNDPAGFFVNIGQQGNLNALMGAAADASEAAKKIDGSNSNLAILRSATYQNGIVTLNCAGRYTDNRAGNYIRGITASYSLLPDPDQIPYQVVPRVAVINSTTSKNYPALLTKALLAEKNIVAAGGEVNITGDVLAFGTIPVKGSEEDLDAPWYKYGGIMAGIPDTSGMNMDGSGMDFGTYFGIDTAKTGTMVSGQINILSSAGAGIRGDAATMAYLHTLYSNDNTDYSSITAQGAAYARAIKSEEPANYSTITLNDAFTTDNLQIDSNESQVSINGIYCGFVTAGYDIDGSGLASASDEYRYKRTSSIVINGDSKLALNGTSSGGVYIGGSTFLRNYLNQAYYPTENRPYMTGISALKASSRIAAAFKEYNALNGETRLYTGNGQYITNPAFTPYQNITDPANPFSTNMLAGSDGTFKQSQRSKHFKWLWEGLWKLDTIYQRYLNSSAIQISVDPDNKITGYSFGAIAANGNVYDLSDYKGPIDATNFGLLQKETWIRNFHNEIQPLLTEEYNATSPKLDYTSNSKHIADYIDTAAAAQFAIPQTVESSGRRGTVYYSAGDCVISGSGGGFAANGQPLTDGQGLIIAGGNIYLPKGFSFDGIILAAKNIVFLGNATITYDKGLIDSLLLDDGVAQLFGLKRFIIEPGSSAIKEQRVSYQNIKLTDWQETK